jgi:hypothetical protein
MAKGMRSSLAMMYPLLFLIVAFVLYYAFKENFMPAYGGYKHDRRNDWQEFQKKELQDKIRQNADQNK